MRNLADLCHDLSEHEDDRVRDLAQGTHRLLLNLRREQQARQKAWQDMELAVFNLRRGVLGE